MAVYQLTVKGQACWKGDLLNEREGMQLLRWPRAVCKGKNTHRAERSGAARPAACDLIRGNKVVDLFPRIKSQAAGHSAPPRSAPLYVFLP
jgi:hypothetical protein